MSLTEDNTDLLERIVDLHGLPKTLDMLADICAEKAEHLRTNWQDKGAAKDWEKAYKLMLKTHDALAKGVSACHLRAATRSP